MCEQYPTLRQSGFFYPIFSSKTHRATQCTIHPIHNLNKPNLSSPAGSQSSQSNREVAPQQKKSPARTLPMGEFKNVRPIRYTSTVWVAQLIFQLNRPFTSFSPSHIVVRGVWEGQMVTVLLKAETNGCTNSMSHPKSAKSANLPPKTQQSDFKFSGLIQPQPQFLFF